jgi:hypothetical protein
MSEFAAMRVMVRDVLQNSPRYAWTVQGLGMMRCYFGDDRRFRLNVWHSSLRRANVSSLHDHPWSFDSWIISGQMFNQRFVEDHYSGDEFNFFKITCGLNGGPQNGQTLKARLRAHVTERYQTGDKYHQDANEIHISTASEGAVTLNDRTVVGDGETARVFWPLNEEWVDAKPRLATWDEVVAVSTEALREWK